MGKDAYGFWLLVVLAFVLTQPGSIAFANWDAPYGFYKDLSVWLFSASGGVLLVMAYGIFEWRRGRLGKADVLLALMVFLITVAVGYRARFALGGEMGYGSGNVLAFLVGGFIGLVLSLLLLPVSLLYALTGDLYYPYDRPLVVAWVVMIIIAIALLVAYLKARKEEAKESGSRDPSVSSSEPAKP